MANVVNNISHASQPIPVSDGEDDFGEDGNSRGAENSQIEKAHAEAPSESVDNGNSPRQNFISPASSPEDQKELVANESARRVDNVSENSDDEGANNFNGNNFIRVSDVAENSQSKNVENVSASPSGSPQQVIVDDLEIAKELNEYIKVNRINWAEIEQLEDLWAICDAISAAHSGLPDSLLKDAFLLVLQEHMSRSKQGWVRQQLDLLIKMWKKEVQSEKSTERPTKFVAASLDYTPPVVVKKRKQNAARKRHIKGLMGVGNILQQARLRFATEDGELDVEEDENGLFTISGQELSFELWKDINRIKDDGIVYDPQALAMTRRPKKRKLVQPIAPVGDLSQSYTSSQNFSTFTASPASSSMLDMPSITPDSFVKNGKKQTPKPQEKDEGELSDSDESGGGSDSASSSSTDEDVTTLRAKNRRKKRRESQRQTGMSSVSNVNDIMHKAFLYRLQIAEVLTIQQKAAFLECLKQNNGAASNARLQQISQIMANSITGGSGASPATNTSI